MRPITKEGKVYTHVYKDYYDVLHSPSDSIEDNMAELAKENMSIKHLQYYYNNGVKKIPVEKDYQDAISDFSKVIEINPKYENVYEERGEVKYDLEDNRGAIIDFTKAIENNPYDRYAYYYRGISKIFLGEKDSGCLDLSKAGELGYKPAYEAIQHFCN